MIRVSNLFVKINGIDAGLAAGETPYKKLIRAVADRLGYTVLKSASHSFKPQGFTSILLLSESHISIHTWPDEKFAVLEMVTCRPFLKKEEKVVTEAVFEFLKTKHLKVERAK